MYADDLVVFSDSISCLQKAADVLYFYCQSNDLTVNTQKTKVMKFRKGGKLKRADVLWYNSAPLSFCNEFEYLGVTVQTTWTFEKHFHEKLKKFKTALNMSKNLRDLSMDGAARYFEVMLKPIITYGIEAIWEDLKQNDLEVIDKCKCSYYKRVMGVHESTKNRLIIIFAGFTMLTEELAHKFGSTVTYNEYIESIERKLSDVDANIFRTPALTQDDWRKSNAKKRHLVLRASVHGFHFKLCTKSKCFERSENCVCRYCDGSSYSLLHVFQCPFLANRSLSYVNEMQ